MRLPGRAKNGGGSDAASAQPPSATTSATDVNQNGTSKQLAASTPASGSTATATPADSARVRWELDGTAGAGESPEGGTMSPHEVRSIQRGFSFECKFGSLRVPRPRTRQEFVDARPVSLFPVGDDGEPVRLGGRNAALHRSELRFSFEGEEVAGEISPQDRHYLNRMLVKSVPSRPSESLARRRDPGD